MILGKQFKLVFYIFCFLLFLTINLVIKNQFNKPILVIDKQNSSLNLDYNFYRFFNLGHKRLYSAALWISTILDSDISHYQNKDNSSWMYLRFKTISKLDPKFYFNYYFGGLYLSVVKDDIVGANTIYQDGLQIFPEDLPLLKNAAFHFYFEAKEIEKAQRLYDQIRKLDDKNIHARIQTARILSANNDTKQAYELLRETYYSNITNNEMIKVKIFEKLNALKIEIDLKCLNQHEQNCETMDLNKQQYQLINGSYIAPKNYQPFK